MKFIHAADIHLDSPLRGLARRAGARAEHLVGATRQAFVNLIDTAIEREVAFLLIAGDVYDGDWKDFSTGVFFARQMGRLVQAGIRVALIQGNHDAANLMSRSLSLPDGVHVFSARKAETLRWDDLGVAIHGRSFPDRAVLQNMVPDYPKPVPGLLNIGMLHTSLTGRDGHEPYAPCALSDLTAHGYDYWALGHVHGREVLSEDPWVIFCGNLQGRHANEAGAKGATLATVEGGRIVSAEPLVLDVLRWHSARVDLSQAASWGDVSTAVAEAVAPAAAEAAHRLLALRVELTGICALHDALSADPDRLRAEVETAAARHAAEVYVEKVKLHTQPPRTAAADAADADALASIALALRSLTEEPEEAAPLLERMSQDLAKLPRALLEESGLIALDEAGLRALLREASDSLRASLMSPGATTEGAAA